MGAQKRVLAEATKQLEEDYKAAVSQFGRGVNNRSDPDLYRMFCIGVTMCTLTMKGYTEDHKLRPQPTMSAEGAIDAYYEAARKAIHAD